MPIYCLNSTTYASRKRSKNALIHELIGDHNYYLSNGSTCIQGHHHHHHHPQHHNLSMASYNILMSRQQQQLCKSLATSSLIVTIDRFKEAVSNMKQTVLVPTMLDALAGHGGTTSAEDQLHPQHCYGSSSSVNNNGNSNSNGNGNSSNGYHYHSGQQLHTSSILEVEEEVETDSACSSDHCSSNNDSGNEGGGGGGGNSRPKSSLSWTSSTTIPPQQPQNAQLGHDDQPMMAVATLQQSNQQQQQQQPPLTMAASLGQHNLYEQYKLLDMIDSILSSDITYMSSRQRYQHQLLFGSASANNNNSSNNNNNPVLLNFPPESNNDDNNNCPVGSSKHHQCCLQMLKTGSGGQQMEESPGEGGGGGLHGEYRSGNPPKLPTPVNGHRSALLGGKLDGLGAGNGHQQEVPTSPTTMEDGDQALLSSSPDSHCSLLKIKEKLEYHLVSLKSILNLLSNTADCITSSYLEGIQCEDHFDSRQLAGGAGKGNGGAGAGGGLNAGSGSELTDFQSPLSSAGSNSNSNGNSSSNSNRHYYTSN